MNDQCTELMNRRNGVKTWIRKFQIVTHDCSEDFVLKD